MPIHVATGGNPQSTIDIAKLGLPIVYAIIGGNPNYFRKLVNLYVDTAKINGYGRKQLKISAHSWGWLSETKLKAEEEYFFQTKLMVDSISVDSISKDRPHWSKMTRKIYQQAIGSDGAMIVGDVNTVANKIICLIETLDLDRFMLHLPIASMPHEKVMNAIKLYGEGVVPIVKEYFRE